MEGEKKEREKILDILLALGNQANEPLVASLLISKGNIHFLECYLQRKPEQINEDDNEEQTQRINEIPDKGPMLIAQDYIG